jgi:hypothetical protein
MYVNNYIFMQVIKLCVYVYAYNVNMYVKCLKYFRIEVSMGTETKSEPDKNGKCICTLPEA